jgi:hypothetical protein|tara:strand:- start:202 stop:486 length:285 start_codon:yes stop_codon:yes gene_type:complete
MKAKDDRKKDPGGYKVYRKIEKNIWKDLRKFNTKWMNYPFGKHDYVRRTIFFMQMRDAMHNALEAGACGHILTDMISKAKKEALGFEIEKYKEK